MIMSGNNYHKYQWCPFLAEIIRIFHDLVMIDGRLKVYLIGNAWDILKKWVYKISH